MNGYSAGSGPLGSGPTGPGSGFSVMPITPLCFVCISRCLVGDGPFDVILFISFFVFPNVLG